MEPDISPTEIDHETLDDDFAKDEPASDELDDADPSGRPSQPGQKRRRVTRACDECRRKKIKCDGRQPCTHCTVYSYDCTYDQPSHRRRNPGPQYIESLERRLHRAEAVLHSIAPHIDLNDPNLDPSSTKSPNAPSFPTSNTPKPGTETPPEIDQPDSATSQDGGLESMIRQTGQMDLDEKGHWDYYGHSSGLSFLRRVRDQFGNVLSPETEGSRSETVGRTRNIGQDFTSPRSPGQIIDSPFDQPPHRRKDLPPREVARRLCHDALDDASAILNLVHKPTFDKGFDRIYSRNPDEYEPQDEKYLPLLYSVLALGCLFDKGAESVLEQSGYEGATDQGYKYFSAARGLLDVTDCRDLVSLQAVIFIILFLQCSAKLSTCYSYIGIALRSALRMGLHRSFRDGFSPLEAETRKRTFWVIRKMDVYVGAMLGLPLTLSEDDFDQDLPSEVDDEYVTESAILPMPKDTVPLAAASNANFRLSKILAKIVKGVYPIKSHNSFEQNPSRTYSVSFATIYELEKDLKNWEEELPPALKPGGAKPTSHIGPMQQLLRMAYAHAQMMLYRPFLHYTSPRSRPNAVDSRAYGCAAACVSVSRNVIHITSTMKKEGLLVGSYWFTMYTAFFAVLSLLYFAAENTESATSQEIMRDAREGREALAQLANRSMAADRCTTTLTSVFNSLEASLNHIDNEAKKDTSNTSRKREAPPLAAEIRPSQSEPQEPATSKIGPPQRAGTFPPNASKDAKHGSNPSRSRTTNKSPPGSRKTRDQPAKSQTTATPAAQTSKRSSHPAKSALPAAETSHSRAKPPQHITLPTSQSRPPLRPSQDDPQRSYRRSLQQHHQQQQPTQQFLPQQMQDLHYSSNLNDLNAMMFPSADPFAYPNQPMTTLEQNYAYTHGIPFGQSHHHNLEMSQSGSSNTNYIPNAHSTQSSGHNEQIDVQLFGPLPPYMLQSAGSAAGYHQAQQHLGMEAAGPEMSASTAGPQEWAQQMRGTGLDNFNYDDVFGNEDEWRGGFL